MVKKLILSYRPISKRGYEATKLKFRYLILINQVKLKKLKKEKGDKK